VHVKRANLRFPFKQVPNRILDLGELLAMILLGIFFAIPETDAQDPIWLCIRDEHDFVGKTALLLQNG
jgi:hypothetical protein